MNVLLVNPPWAEVYGKYQSAAKLGNAYPPLNLCYLAAVLEAAGHRVQIIDAEMESQGFEEISDAAKAFGPDLVGMTSTSAVFHIAASLARKLKESLGDVVIVAGGPHMTALPEASLQSYPEIDFGLIGESEQTFLQFLSCMEAQQDPAGVPGLVYRKGDEIEVNPTAQIDQGLDELPFPDRSKLDLDCYRWSVPGKGIVRFTTIMTRPRVPIPLHILFGLYCFWATGAQPLN